MVSACLTCGCFMQQRISLSISLASLSVFISLPESVLGLLSVVRGCQRSLAVLIILL